MLNWNTKRACYETYEHRDILSTCVHIDVFKILVFSRNLYKTA